jgi:hypothetical protein
MTWLRARWELVALAVSLVLVAGLILRACTERAPVHPPIVLRPDSVVLRQRPTPKPPSGLGRIARHRVPVTRRETAGTPDTANAGRYARRVFEAESLRAVIRRLRAHDSTGAADRVAATAPPAMLPPVAGTYDGHRLDLWLTRSNGAVMLATVKLRPRWSFVAGAAGLSDTVPLVTEDRWWLRTARHAVHCAPAAAVLALAGALLDSDSPARGAALGGGGGLAACLY